MDKKALKTLAGVLFLFALLIALIYFIFVKNDQAFAEIIHSYGLFGLFLGSIIANASILLPLPIDIFVFLLANEPFVGEGLVNAIALGLVAGLGSAIGEMSGYILGLMGAAGIESIKEKQYEKLSEIKHNIKELGTVFIVLGAFTPFPFDLIGIAAGLIKFDPKRFFFAALIGKVLRYVVIAVAGFYSIGFVRAIFEF